MILRNIQAVIYDMDGVLTDSEPIWKVAMEQVFSEVGCNLTRHDFEKTVGLRIDEVCEFWYSQKAWTDYSPKQVENKIVARMVELLNQHATALPGVAESLVYFSSLGLKIGLATSSYQLLIETILSKLQIKSHFQVLHSAEFEDFGKPHPAVFITCAQKLGVSPLNCLVIEDSVNGVIAAKAARMTVVCIPEKSHEPSLKLAIADYMFQDLNQLLIDIKSNI